jgi:hypothetical protein
MDLLDKIMKDMDKNKPPPVNKTDQAIIQSEFFVKIVFKSLARKILIICNVYFDLNCYHNCFYHFTEQKQQQEHMKRKEKQILNDFRIKIQKKIASFLTDETLFLEFAPMEKVFRQIM